MNLDFISTTAVLGVMIPIIAMLIGLVIALFAIQRNYRTRQLEHDLRMRALEKGYDIPPMPITQKAKPVYPFTWPFIFLGFGIALICIYLFADGEEETLSFGLIIFFIGVALFGSRYYGVKKDELAASERTLDREWRAPQQAMPPAEPPSVAQPQAGTADSHKENP